MKPIIKHLEPIIRQVTVLSLAGVLLFSSCSSYKSCGDLSAKDPHKLHPKRYRKAILERDSLCNLAKARQADLTALNSKYDKLNADYESLQSTTGYQLNKANSALTDKQKALAQKEQRLRELESMIMRRDSLLESLFKSVKDALLGFNADELTVYTNNGKVYV